MRFGRRTFNRSGTIHLIRSPNTARRCDRDPEQGHDYPSIVRRGARDIRAAPTPVVQHRHARSRNSIADCEASRSLGSSSTANCRTVAGNHMASLSSAPRCRRYHNHTRVKSPDVCRPAYGPLGCRMLKLPGDARAARKIDQYAARKVDHLKGVHSTRICLTTGQLTPSLVL